MSYTYSWLLSSPEISKKGIHLITKSKKSIDKGVLSRNEQDSYK